MKVGRLSLEKSTSSSQVEAIGSRGGRTDEERLLLEENLFHQLRKVRLIEK